MIGREGKIQKAYDLLEDEKSRELFIAKMAMMICNNNIWMFKEFLLNFSEAVNEFGLIPFQPYGPKNYYYFNNDVYSLSSNEIYMDIGAHDGDSVGEFVQACINESLFYKHIYALEPDPVYFSALKKNTKHLKNISCHELAIWSRTEKLRFQSSPKTEVSGSSGIYEQGDIEISAVSLDDFLNGAKISLLKMDPPGNVMLEAMKGGYETISKYKPKIALGAYHSFEALFEAPLLLHEICRDYKIYLRHNSWGINETDLLAFV